jgi:5-methylcytosine-specific restriction endonuclease McrA
MEIQKLHTIGEYPLNEILSHIGFQMPNIVLITQNHGKFEIKVNSSKMECFRRDTFCVLCGMKPNLWRLERQKLESGNPHLNLYFQSKYGRSVLFNKDHRVPKSRGGSDKISNLQTTCVICNEEKGSNLFSL